MTIMLPIQLILLKNNAMKKIIFSIAATLFSALLNAQVHLNLNYDYMDYAIANSAGVDYDSWVFEVNNAYTTSNPDMGKWVEVRYDSLINFDYNTGTVLNTYQLAASTMRIDSFSVEFKHVNHSGTNNAITFTIYKDGEPTGASTHSGTVAWTQTINTSTSLSPGRQPNGLPTSIYRSFYPGITLSQGQHFSIRMTFTGSISQDTLFAITGNRDDCNDACTGGKAAFIPNSYSYVYLSNGGYLLTPGSSSVYYDCNNNQTFDPNLCEYYITQNFSFDTYVTLVSTGYYINTGGTHTVCSGVFYDSGGPNGDYGSFEDYTIIFTSATPGYQIKMTFLQFDTEYNSDNLAIYDGTTTSHPLINAYSGSYSFPFEVTSTSGNLTFRFTSNGGGEYEGWRSNISCVPTPLDVTVDPNYSSICIGNSVQLQAQASGGVGSYSYSWSPAATLSNPSVANPIATPTASTTYTVTVTDGTFTDTDNSTVSVSSCVGIDENSAFGNVNVYPNPNDGNFILQIEGYNSSHPLMLELFTIESRCMYEEIIPAQTDTRKNIEFKNLNEGLYLLRISNKDNQMLKRIVVQGK